MDKERLQILPFEALLDIAQRSGIDGADEFEKESLIDQILEVIEEDRFDRERSNNIEMLVKEKKFELSPNDSLENTGIEELSIPSTYDETKIVLMLRDPSWAFAYWDLSPEHLAFVPVDDDASRFRLRVWEVLEGEAPRYFDIPVRGDEKRWYVNLPRSGREYYVELVYAQLDDDRLDSYAESSRIEAQQAAQGENTGGDGANGSGEGGSRDTSFKNAENVGAAETMERILCRSNRIHSPNATVEDGEFDDEFSYANILSVAGLPNLDELAGNGAIPQRIISLLDTQYLHLKG